MEMAMNHDGGMGKEISIGGKKLVNGKEYVPFTCMVDGSGECIWNCQSKCSR